MRYEELKKSTNSVRMFRALEHTCNFVNYCICCSSSELMRGFKRSLDTDWLCWIFSMTPSHWVR